MSVWTKITGSFYIYECKDDTYKRLQSFIKENKHLLPTEEEGVFDFDIKEASFRTGIRYDSNRNRIEVKGAAQLHIFGDLRDMTTELAVKRIIPFVKVLREAFDVRIGQVFLDDGCGCPCSIQIKQYDEEIKTNVYKKEK